MRALVARPPAGFAEANAAALTDLGGRQASYEAGQLTVTGSTAHELVTEHIPIAGVGTIAIKTTLRLTDASGGWRVDWSPATIAPELTDPGDKLSLQVT